jgi:signal transduction histidine kinase
MVRIIRELLYNAAKYSDGLHIRLHISETSTHVLFTVEDVGPGLSGNVDELMNKPFNKLDDLSEGLGLGLPLTKRHALSMGGDLIYDANYSAGCRFIVEMPK